MQRLYTLIILGLLIAWSGNAHTAIPVSLATGIKPTLAPLIKKVIPAIVNISAKSTRYHQHPLFNDPFFQHFFGQSLRERREEKSAGSGVIIDAKRGYVVTNNHVIDNADEIFVSLKDGRHLKAKLVGTDPESDIAVLKIPAKDLTDIEFADNSALEVGDFAIAIGNPFGLTHSVTMGIISALGRSGLGINDFENFIQTDAPINPGNSGGALIDMEGKLIGILTAILSRSGGSMGIGFATTSEIVEKVVKQLTKYGQVKRGTLDISYHDLSPDLAQQLNLPNREGVIITTHSKSSPDLKSGDVITKFGSVSIKNSAHLRTLVGLSDIGTEEPIEGIRDGKVFKTKVKIAPPPTPKSLQGDSLLSGAKFITTNKGVQISSVKRNSSADRLNLQKKDIILELNGGKVSKITDLDRLLKKNRSGIQLKIQRGRSILQMDIRT